MGKSHKERPDKYKYLDKKKKTFKKNKFDKKPNSVIVEPDSNENNYE